MDKDLLFISWTSRDGIGEVLGKHFQDFFDSVFGCVLDTFFSKKDMIGHAAGWQNVLIKDKLAKTKYGVFLLSQDAVESPWVSFELGMIVGNKNNTNIDKENRRIFPIKLSNNLDRSKSPFNNYQIIDFTKENIHTISNLIAGEYSQLDIDDVFEKQWTILEKKVQGLNSHRTVQHNNNHPFFDNVKEYLYLILKAENDDEDILFIPSFLSELFDNKYSAKFAQTIDYLYDKGLLASKQPIKVLDQAYKANHNLFYLNYKNISFQIKIMPSCRIRIDGYPLSVEGVEYYNKNYNKANNDVMTNYQSALQAFLGDKARITTLKN